MSDSPRQDFIYGFYADQVPRNDNGFVDIYQFCRKNGLVYSCSHEGVAVGFQPDWTKITGTGYLGGYYVSEFNVNAFAEWLGDAYAAMTDEKATVIKEFLQIYPNESPELWTLSGMD
jgi:hypothetical protein